MPQNCVAGETIVRNAEGVPVCQKIERIGILVTTGSQSLATTIGVIIRGVLGLTGVIALIMFVYGGFLYLASGGNEDRVTKGKGTVIWAALGLVAVFSAYAIADFVIKALK